MCRHSFVLKFMSKSVRIAKLCCQCIFLLKSAFNGEYNIKAQFCKRKHGLVCSFSVLRATGSVFYAWGVLVICVHPCTQKIFFLMDEQLVSRQPRSNHKESGHILPAPCWWYGNTCRMTVIFDFSPRCGHRFTDGVPNDKSEAKGAFYKPVWFDKVRFEYWACREEVCLIDMSTFTKFEFTVRRFACKHSVVAYSLHNPFKFFYH